jgi:hypothetical protein
LTGGDACIFQPDVHLVFHEKFGSWHAWRFAIIFQDIELTVNDDLVKTSKINNITIPEHEIQKAKSLIKNLTFQKDTAQTWL